MTSDESSAAPVPMKYGLLGEDLSSASEKLENYSGRVPWSYLTAAYRNGSLYFVDPGLALDEVGIAFSRNRKEQVEAWLRSGDLVKIEAIHARQWEQGDPEFEALIVSPFVLCRPIGREGPDL